MVQQKGPLKPTDPNNPILKPTTPDLQAKVRKRVLESSEKKDDKEQDGISERPVKRNKTDLESLLEAKSSHSHLVDEFEEQQGEAYFSKLERKEQMEIKMLNTFEVKTTAVTCPKVTAAYSSSICSLILQHIFLVQIHSPLSLGDLSQGRPPSSYNKDYEALFPMQGLQEENHRAR